MARRFKAKYTEEELVEILALAGSSNESIAEVLGVCKSTVKNNYQELLTECREVAFGKVAGEIYHIAMLPIRDEAGEKLAPELVKAKTALLTFLAKTRLQWRETTRIEHEGLQNVTPVMNLVIGGSAELSIDRSAPTPEAISSPDESGD